jgi:hypothetical protein
MVEFERGGYSRNLYYLNKRRNEYPEIIEYLKKHYVINPEASIDVNNPTILYWDTMSSSKDHSAQIKAEYFVAMQLIGRLLAEHDEMPCIPFSVLQLLSFVFSLFDEFDMAIQFYIDIALDLEEQLKGKQQ